MTSKEHILDTIKACKTDLQQFGVRSIGLFGSYSHDKQTNKSDIDILIDFYPDKETFDNYMAIWDYLTGIFKKFKVELVTKNGLSPYIGPKILEEVLYA